MDTLCLVIATIIAAMAIQFIGNPQNLGMEIAAVQTAIHQGCKP